MDKEFDAGAPGGLERLYGEMLDKKPAPNKGPVRFSVWSPYARGDGVEFEFRLSRSGDLKRGKYDAQVKLRASKRGEEPVWISPGSAKGYRDAGYRVPVAPKVMGLDRVASADVGDLVLITDTPLDYYALNCALLSEGVARFGAIGEDLGEAVGCAVMGLEGYAFDDRVANDFLTGKRVVVLDYGRNSERARRIAGNISNQRIAQSVSVWRLGPAAAEQGLFKRHRFPECGTALQLKSSCADLCADVRGGLIDECEEVTTAVRGGMLYDLKKEFKPAEFYLYPLIPKNGISLLCGEGGTGKSAILMNWAAKLSRGDNELIESHYEQDDFGKVNVLWLTREESREVVVGPRAVRSGADEQHFRIVQCLDHKSGSKANLKFGDRELEEIIAGLDVADEDRPDFRFHPDVVFVDSLQTFIKGDAKNGDAVVAATDWLLEMAGRYNVSFCLMHHFRKGGGDFRDSISEIHKVYDYSRFVGVAIRDPKDESRIVVHAEKLSDYRGIDRIPNLIYEKDCEDKRNAPPFVRLVGTDFRSEETLTAQREQNRLDARGNAANARRPKAEEIREAVRKEYDKHGLIVIDRIQKRLIGSGFGRNSVSSGVTALARELGLVKRAFAGTIFSKPGFGGAVGGPVEPESYVYVAEDDALDKAGGIVQLALSMDDPITEPGIRAEVNKKLPAKEIHLAFEQLKESHGFKEVNGEYYHPDSYHSKISAICEKIGNLGKPVSVPEAMRAAGADEVSVRAAFRMLVKEAGYALSQDGSTATPPQGRTRRGHSEGQQVLGESLWPSVL